MDSIGERIRNTQIDLQLSRCALIRSGFRARATPFTLN